ncbi:alpha-(1,3)-fucosyltransferase 7-like [Babylonia areolata]|uniref:alpha-(1,3)-fucosyltransferase 7-like n=1 Tax=Babylonia areolata TaxID=304850 RepID=UPI003FD12989
MRVLKTSTAGSYVQILKRFCTIRNYRRRHMRSAAFVMIGLFLFLVLAVGSRSASDAICIAEADAGRLPCRSRRVREPFKDKSTFVTTFPHLRERRTRGNVSIKRILRWSGFFFDMTWEDTDDRYFASCAESRCTMTNDRSLVEQSDAVLFHAHDVFNFWRSYVMPESRLPHQVWILYYLEPPTRTPLSMGPLAGVFNWTAGYRLDSDVPVHYGGYTRYPGDRYGSNHTVNHARLKPRLAAWMSSNCHDFNRRQLLVRRLKNALGDDLDLYGGCNSRRCPETICADTLSNYKFYLALENANCRDYVTEKFWAALARQQVPVVMGGASSEDYRKVAPPDSFLHVDDFPSPDHLARHLLYLSRNQTAYNRHLAWTRTHEVYSELPARRRWWCDLCQALHDNDDDDDSDDDDDDDNIGGRRSRRRPRPRRRRRPYQVYSDLQGWFQEDTCPQWTVMNQLSRLVDGLKIKLGLL